MKQKILTGVSIVFGLLFINGGLNKFFNYMPVPENLPDGMVRDFNALTEISWLMPLIGLAEAVGGVLVLFGRTRALGALIVFPVMVGILLTHIFVAPDGLIMALVLWAILGWMIYENRERYLPIIRTEK